MMMMNKLTIKKILITVLLLTFPVVAQTKGTVYELGFPATDTSLLFQYKWRVSGWIYPEGTYQNFIGDCTNGLNPFTLIWGFPQPIGVYVLNGESGDSSRYTGKYILTLVDSDGNATQVYEMSGLFEYSETYFRPDYYLVELYDKQNNNHIPAQWRPRSGLTFGGTLVIYK